MSAVAARVAAALQSTVVGERRIEGGYTQADRRVLELADGRRVFAKTGTEELSSGWLHDEARLYTAARADFLPELVAFLSEDPPVLVLEDLSGARWPPPWRPGDVDAVTRTLERVRAAPPPPGTPPVDAELLRGNWGRVAGDPAPFLSLGIAGAQWLETALPVLAAAEAAAHLDGDELLHLDMRSDNLCLREVARCSSTGTRPVSATPTSTSPSGSRRSRRRAGPRPRTCSRNAQPGSPR